MESALAVFFSKLPTADSVFLYLLLSAIFLFVCVEIGWVLRKHKNPASLQIPKQHVDLFWSLLPALVLIFLTKVL